jgi:hypothetical protein
VLSTIVALAAIVANHGPDGCVATPAVNVLSVVGPMVGTDPVWIVDGHSRDIGGPSKTLWVVARTVDGPLRVTGRRLDGAGVLSFQDGYQRPITRELVFENPAKQSVRPGGASAEVMRAYAFLPSYVIYPAAGCWEFTARLGSKEARFTIDLTTPPPPKYQVTDTPLDVGTSRKLCIAVDGDDVHGGWWWEPGTGPGCSSRSTGSVFTGEQGRVTRANDTIEAAFRLQLHARPGSLDRDHLDVRLVISANRMRSVTTGAEVEVNYRGDLDVPER